MNTESVPHSMDEFVLSQQLTTLVTKSYRHDLAGLLPLLSTTLNRPDLSHQCGHRLFWGSMIAWSAGKEEHWEVVDRGNQPEVVIPAQSDPVSELPCFIDNTTHPFPCSCERRLFRHVVPPLQRNHK